MIVLDASVVLALLFDESGSNAIRQLAETTDAVFMSAANYSEVLQKVKQRGGSLKETEIVMDGIVTVEQVTREDAACAADLWQNGDGLSLGDRLCLALAHRLDCLAYTMDTAWSKQPQARVISRSSGSG